MSAFVPSKTHYDLLVKTIMEGPEDWSQISLTKWSPYARLDIVNIFRGPNDLGQILLDETIESVSYRYPDDHEMIPEWSLKPYEYEDPGIRLTCLEFLQALLCYSYQSCEHYGWEYSSAKDIVERMSLRVATALVLHICSDELDKLPWEWTEDEVAKKVARSNQ